MNEYMKEALKEAKKAYKKLEVPVGAVIVKDGKIIAKAHNLRENKISSLAHAEILCIEKACKKLGTWRLEGAQMYVTLEPCPMCTGAVINARMAGVVFGASDEKSGACGGYCDLSKANILNHTFEVQKGVMENECKDILNRFFKDLRNRTKKEL